MSTVKTLASAVTVGTGILGVYGGSFYPAPEGSQTLIIVLGVLLLVVSLACFYGANIAFAGSALLSGALLFAGWVGWEGGHSGLEWTTLAVASVDIALCVLAYRSSQGISEEGHPMNLPVFG